MVLIVPVTHRLAGQVGFILRARQRALILLHSGFCTRRLVDKVPQAAGVCANLLIEMNTIQGVLATVRATGAARCSPPGTTAARRGEFMRCETCSYLAA